MTPDEIIMSKRDEMAWEICKIKFANLKPNDIPLNIVAGAYAAVATFLKVKNDPEHKGLD